MSRPSEHTPSTMSERIDLDWAGWMRRYDAQLQRYAPARERCFETIIDVVGALAPADAAVLDLGAGPGSLSTRLLTRLPGATCVALDADPVMLVFGRRAASAQHTGVAERLRWVRSDVVDEDWRGAVRAAGVAPVRAVVSSTALHYLPLADLVRVYREVAEFLPAGGCFVNGDMTQLPPHLDLVRRAVGRVRERREQAARQAGVEDWTRWWKALERASADDAELSAAFAERARSAVLVREQPRPVGTAFHLAALAEAGFAEVTTVWQDLEDVVLLAVR